MLTSLQENRKSHVLLYESNIGQHSAKISWEQAKDAMIPDWYPAESQAIKFGLGNSSVKDDTKEYWIRERENLQYWIEHSVLSRIRSGDIHHLSIFAFSTQPLLIELGRLISDIPAAEVYQLHREPPDWKWQETSKEINYIIEEPAEIHPIVALNLSLSANIDNSRIEKIFPDNNLSIWHMTISNPNNDFLKSKEQLKIYRQIFRFLLNRIKARHGQETILHLFPAIPVAMAVEIGRVWMPKADISLYIYDQNKNNDGFAFSLKIGV